MSEQSMPNKNQIFFMQLVINFQNAAWQALGKIKNPLTDKIERNLEQAHYAIDMLEMFRHYTRNNLDDNEKRLLDSLIRDLQLNFVDEVEKEKKAAESQKPEEKSEAAQKGPEKEGTAQQEGVTDKAQKTAETAKKAAQKKKTTGKTAGKKAAKKS